MVMLISIFCHINGNSMEFQVKANGFTMEFKLKTKGFSMDTIFFKWVFYGVSIEKNQRRPSPQGKLLLFSFF
jgi:hypothetical protein